MKICSTLHNHCMLCDGASTLQEMAAAAYAAGFSDLGISCHTWAPFDPGFGVRDEPAYRAAVAFLRESWRGRLRISCGMEQDFYAPAAQRDKLDYVIGSLHYLADVAQGRYFAVDSSAAQLAQAIEELFDGNGLAAAEAYYRELTRLARQQQPDIIGHFDLVVKHNRGNRFFDEESAAYRDAALTALEAVAATGAVFELNTRAVYRGHRAAPYPADFLLRRLWELGAPVMLSADCHLAAELTAGLTEAAARLRGLGFREVAVWHDGGFTSQRL